MEVGTADGVLQQFTDFRKTMEENNEVRDKLREVASKLEDTTRQMHSALLVVHGGTKGAVEAAILKAKSSTEDLQGLFGSLAGILDQRPGQYFRYHDIWRSPTQSAVFIFAFIQWLETSSLLSHSEAKDLLGFVRQDFPLELDDYLIGLCNLSNEMARYVVNRVTVEDYTCPERVSALLNQLNAGFRLLNLRNDMLRRRYDGLKYDLKKVEEVLYDVKIRGLDKKAEPDNAG